MSIEENKILVRRYFEDAPHDPAICDEIFAPRFQFHTIQHASITAQSVESDLQSEKAAYEWLVKVWSPDWCMTVDEMIAEVWDISDRLWLWQQLGVLPEIKEAIAARLNTK